MSSHHFVKEGQEPSVWILGTSFQEDILGTLLEWSPFVVANLLTAEKLFSMQVKIDRIFSDVHDSSAQQFFTALYPIEWIHAEDVHAKLWQFIEYHQTHVYLVGYDPDQLSETYSIAPPHLKQYLIGVNSSQKWICPPQRWNKWLAKGQKFTLTGDPADWKIQGNISGKNHVFISGDDQLILFENTKQHCYIEHLTSAH